MRIAALLTALPALALTLASAAGAETSRAAPFELMRSLEALQNQAAEGNAAAYAARPKLIALIAERFQAADPAVWREPRNVRAAITYVLNGGQPAMLRKLADLNVFPKQDEKLVKGALAYAEGREDDAKVYLGDLDAQSWPPSLGGQLALVQSTLAMGNDRHKAIVLLDLARLLMPGTLVEDVALRREIIAYAEAGDIDKFLSLSEQYARRFRRSVYADNFMQGFAASVAKLASPVDPQTLRRLEGLVALLGPDEQRSVYLSIAQISAIRGNVTMTRFAAEHALPLCREGSIDLARAKLYQAAALIVTDDYDSGLAALDGIAKVELPERDGQLRRAVIGLARELREWPQATEPAATAHGKPGVGDQAATSQPSTSQPANSATTISLAQKQIADVDLLLKRGAP
ncbi:chemotaxis protein MotC [Rhizobiales bacterium GAS191]|nr:chemotaxis protein MotC [Rhizobiales bacterium GAS191]